MLMQTKHRIVEFLAALAPVVFLILIPSFLVGRLVDPPYNVVGWAIVLTIAWLVIRRRERERKSIRDWRPDRDAHRISGHGASQ
jgi:hypothetical protein